MSDWRHRVDNLVELMNDFGLERARQSGEGWSLELSKTVPVSGGVPMMAAAPAEAATSATLAAKPKKAARRAAEVARGIPVTTPMMGIYYAAPSPGAPNFVSVGQEVTEGQVVGLVEAMKTFNEILAPQSGVITSVEATNGQLVEPGTVLVRIE
ncbi:hypothetical protein CCB81_10655 [Armatimonadetes bacterium Uphvl-Ar2]|nr:hypothetical protein CCB81_10655 [Armatimonadetes bacterium Uphvl-Ar2]